MHEQNALKERIKENNEKIELNEQLPYLVGNIVEVFIAKSFAIFIMLLLFCYLVILNQA